LSNPGYYADPPGGVPSPGRDEEYWNPDKREKLLERE